MAPVAGSGDTSATLESTVNTKIFVLYAKLCVKKLIDQMRELQTV